MCANPGRRESMPSRTRGTPRMERAASERTRRRKRDASTSSMALRAATVCELCDCRTVCRVKVVIRGFGIRHFLMY